MKLPIPHKALNGTATGTLFGLAGLLPWEDMLRTAILAAIGAIISFTVTLLLQWLRRRK